jgi:SAM-dependent methyltransferase
MAMLKASVMDALTADLYALTHRGNPGDVGFYQGVCRGASSILELGVGYGRLLPHLAPKTELYVGLDREAQFLKAARRVVREGSLSQVRLVEEEMEHFDLGERFDRIVLPYSGLYCLLSKRSLLACLRRVRAHLTDKGEFVFDVWTADGFFEDPEAEGYYDEPSPVMTVVKGKRSWDVYEESRLYAWRQRLDVAYHYVPEGSGPNVTIRIPQRYAPREELSGLLAQTGLRLRHCYGGFKKERLGSRSDHLVMRATRG